MQLTSLIVKPRHHLQGGACARVQVGIMSAPELLTVASPQEQALADLWQAAEFLDAVDAGLVLPAGRQYQEAANRAQRLLRQHQGRPFDRLCELSWALGDIRDNLRFEAGDVNDPSVH